MYKLAIQSDLKNFDFLNGPDFLPVCYSVTDIKDGLRNYFKYLM